MSGIHSAKKIIFSCFICLLLLFTIVSSTDCDKEKCPGPIKFYEDIQCIPMYKIAGDCCPNRYDCSHLFKRSVDMCYANGTEYAVGKKLEKIDRLNPCSIGCYCNKYGSEVAKFVCSTIDCYFVQPKPGCYLKRKFDVCCHSEEVCPESTEERTKCVVDGKTYLDGDIFYPNSGPKRICQCMKGYKGVNELPYCKKTTCHTEEYYPSKIYDKCAPVYSTDSSPVYTCTSQFRCQKDNDTIINKINEESNENDDMICKFGLMKLRIGEELNQSNDFTSKCVRCKCEVPPTLTCQRLSQAECKIKFDKTN